LTGVTWELFGRDSSRLSPVLVLLVALMALFAFVFIRKTQEVRQLWVQEVTLQQQNQQTAEDNTRLQRSIRYYRTPKYIESAARSVFGYTMPGDISIISRPKIQRVVMVRPAPPPPLPSAQPVWKQWWYAFFG